VQEIPKDLKRLLFGRGARWHAWVAIIWDTLGLVSIILGIISGAMDTAVGLEASIWFLMAIAFIVFGLSAWLCAYTAAKEG